MSGEAEAEMPVCVTYEDRPEVFIGVELLARSLGKWAPGLTLVVYSPCEDLGARLRGLKNVQWEYTTALAGTGWNVKPEILLRALTLYRQVCWLDTDVVIAADPTGVLRSIPFDTVAIGEDLHGVRAADGWIRAEGHGLIVSRVLPFAPNSGTLVVSQMHRAMIVEWQKLLGGAAYQAAQRLPRIHRPPAHDGDQDVLWALLISPEFADVPLRFLRLGRDLLLPNGANGYHVLDRLQVMMGARPPFVHMLGPFKPWSFPDPDKNHRQKGAYTHLVCFETSPFFAAAEPFAAELGAPKWLQRRTWPGRLLNAVALGRSALSGFPLALAAWVGSGLKRLKGS